MKKWPSILCLQCFHFIFLVIHLLLYFTKALMHDKSEKTKQTGPSLQVIGDALV